MSFPLTPIGEVISPITTWNPSRVAGSKTFRYIDLSSVDRDEKAVSAPTQITVSEAPSRARQLVKTGDILVSTVRPNLNAVAVVDDELDGATASTGFSVLRPATAKATSRYIYHWVRTPSFVTDMVRKATGASYPAVSDRIVAESLIPLPPLPEQRRIAGILDAADALRRRRREALALLDTLPGAIFAEMFGDPRDNPLGYPARKLSDLCSRITVGVVIKPASYYVDEGVPALRSVNVREGGFDLKDLKYFSQETNDGPLNKSKMKKGDVIIVRTGQPGRAAVVDEEVAGANCIDMLIASPKEDELLPYFLEAFLNSDAGRQMALSNQTGQVQQHLNATALKGIDFITPPIEEQREFARRLDEVRRVKEHLITHLTELDTLFASLQSRAFAGEL